MHARTAHLQHDVPSLKRQVSFINRSQNHKTQICQRRLASDKEKLHKKKLLKGKREKPQGELKDHLPGWEDMQYIYLQPLFWKEKKNIKQRLQIKQLTIKTTTMYDS